MIAVVMIDYLTAAGIGQVYKRAGAHSRLYAGLLLAASLISNVGVLIYYKYTTFVLENISELFSLNLSIPKIVLPIGISFFTFQAMSYVIDVYRKDVAAQNNPFYVLLYVSLFPQLIAGPIVRYKTVENEIIERTISLTDVTEGLERFIIGLAKKLIIANKTGELADQIFNGSFLSTPTMWLAAIAYTFQIYFDFSAYSDMAIGLGRVFGFHFEENFDFPYISKSITEFWRRWHISLSTWFRDYIYIPLGGNRCSVFRNVMNMFIVWLITGFWHGASWNFVLWGLYYFIFLILEKFLFKRILDKIPAVFSHIYTLGIVLFGWVLFRAETLGQCKIYIKTMLIPYAGEEAWQYMWMYLEKYGLFLLLGFLFSMPVYRTLIRLVNRFLKHRFLSAKRALKYAVLFALFYISVLYLVNSTYNPFIYFRF
jgi:alginate O-acetyltransferase complex protein AlgI